MNTKSFFLSGLAGTIVSFLLGFLLYGLLFTNIYPDDAEQSMMFVFFGCLFYTFTFALIFSRLTHISNFDTGVKSGFLIGLLWALSMNFFMYASMVELDSNFMIIVAIDSVSAAIMGGVIALVIGKTQV